VDQFTEFFKNLTSNFSQFWQGLSNLQKIIGGVITGLLVALVVTFFATQQTQQKFYLYKDLSLEDNTGIVSELKKMGVTNFIVNDKGILVDEDQIMPLRLKLAEQGLPTQGQIGWEKFDQQDFTRTEFEQKIHKMRAIQGELSRTINLVEGIIQTRVHIVTPKKSLFVDDEKEPSAAIYVKTSRGSTLNKTQIKGIVHLVSSSIEGLRPEKVTIIDHEGKMLTQVQTDDVTAKRTQEMLAYRRSLEKEMEKKIRIIVGRIVGPDRVEAKVDVEVDFTKEEQSISDIDPDKVVVLASNTTNQEMQGNGLNPTGIPGAKSNVPGEQEELVVNSNSSKSTRNSERLNYEISKSHSRKIMPVGTTTRITAAVLVDGNQPYPLDGSTPAFSARSPEEMKKIEEIVKTSIGYKEKRDVVTVHNMLFQLDPYQIEAIKEKKTEDRKYISTLSLSAAIALGLVMFFAFIVRPYFRWLSYDPERKKSESLIEEFKPDLEQGGIQNIQVKEDVPFDKLSPSEQIMYLAKHEPARTTEAIRIMLNPHAN